MSICEKYYTLVKALIYMNILQILIANRDLKNTSSGNTNKRFLLFLLFNLYEAQSSHFSNIIIQFTWILLNTSLCHLDYVFCFFLVKSYFVKL